MDWTENGMEMEKGKKWTGNGNGVERKGKKVNWEDEWIMIPPTLLSNRLWLVMTGLNQFLLFLLNFILYN